jgi:hypothetical protein
MENITRYSPYIEELVKPHSYSVFVDDNHVPVFQCNISLDDYIKLVVPVAESSLHMSNLILNKDKTHEIKITYYSSKGEEVISLKLFVTDTKMELEHGIDDDELGDTILAVYSSKIVTKYFELKNSDGKPQ